MKIKLDKKGREFAAKKDIKALFINPDLDSKESCCTIGTVDFDVSTKAIGKLESYHKYEDENIEIYVNPNTVSYTHLTLPTTSRRCRSRWSPYH